MSNSTNNQLNKKKIKVNHVSTFGHPIRGVSPYSDDLLAELNKLNAVEHTFTNCWSKITNYVHPAKQIISSSSLHDHLDFFNPFTWNNCFKTLSEIIHAQYWTPIQLPALIYIFRQARRKHIKVVLTVHNPKQHETLPFATNLERKLFALADAIVAHTDQGKRLLEGIDALLRNKTVVIPHGAPTVKSMEPASKLSNNSILASLDLDPNSSYIIFFGNIRKYKGIEILLEAWEIAQPRNPDISLIVAGRLWKGSSIASSIAGYLLGTKKVADKILERKKRGTPKNTRYMLDFIKEEDCRILLGHAKLAIFPYLDFESQSGAAIKAASYGAPLIVSDTGGLPSLAIDESFILPQDFTSSDLANLITLKLTDPDSGMRLRQLEKLTEINWSKIASKYSELYLNMTL